MDTLRDSTGDPPNNMYKALVMQAILAVIVTLLAFGFRGKMARSEAILRQQRQHEQQSRNFCEEKHIHNSMQDSSVQEKKASEAATNCSTTAVVEIHP